MLRLSPDDDAGGGDDGAAEGDDQGGGGVDPRGGKIPDDSAGGGAERGGSVEESDGGGGAERDGESNGGGGAERAPGGGREGVSAGGGGAERADGGGGAFDGVGDPCLDPSPDSDAFLDSWRYRCVTSSLAIMGSRRRRVYAERRTIHVQRAQREGRPVALSHAGRRICRYRMAGLVRARKARQLLTGVLEQF